MRHWTEDKMTRLKDSIESLVSEGQLTVHQGMEHPYGIQGQVEIEGVSEDPSEILMAMKSYRSFPTGVNSDFIIENSVMVEAVDDEGNVVLLWGWHTMGENNDESYSASFNGVALLVPADRAEDAKAEAQKGYREMIRTNTEEKLTDIIQGMDVLGTDERSRLANSQNMQRLMRMVAAAA